VELTYIPYKELERIRKLDCNAIERTQLFATLARINTLYMIMQAGSGHIGSSFSAMDIVSWLYLNEMDLADDPDAHGDVYFSSKGHDAPGYYSVLLGLGRLEFCQIHELRRLNGLPGHPDVITPGIQTNTGSLGTGISKAKGMALAHRLQDKKARIYVLTGDGELQEGQFWESLPSAVHQGLNEITVIIDHNKIQSDTLLSLVNDLGDLEAKLSAFGWHVTRCDGHDPVLRNARP
jgi:transketolase